MTGPHGSEVSGACANSLRWCHFGSPRAFSKLDGRQQEVAEPEKKLCGVVYFEGNMVTGLVTLKKTHLVCKIHLGICQKMSVPSRTSM